MGRNRADGIGQKDLAFNDWRPFWGAEDSPQTTTSAPFTQSGVFSSSQSDVFSPTKSQSQFPFAQTNIFSTARSDVSMNQNDPFPPTQSNLSVTQNNTFLPTQPGSSGTQNGIFSPTQSGSSFTQNGVVSPSQSGSTAPRNGIFSPTQSGNTAPQSGIFSPTQSGNTAPQSGIFSPTQSGNTAPQNGIFSPTQSGNTAPQSGIFSPTQSGNTAPQSGIFSPTQSGNTAPQNGIFSSTQSGSPFTQNGVVSPAQSGSPFTQNGVGSPTQSGSSFTQNGAFSPTQSGSPFTQNGIFSPTRSGSPATQSNIFSTTNSGVQFPTVTDSTPIQTNSTPTQSATFASAPSNFMSSMTNTTGSQSGSLSTPTDVTSTKSSAPPTVMQLTLATMLAGEYSNVDQYQDDIDKNVTGLNKHVLIKANYVPVVITNLSQDVTIYYQQSVNGSTSRQAIYVFTQESPCHIRMSTYDISNASRYSLTPEGLQALETLTLSELANRPECDAFWEQLEDESFTSFLSTDQCTFEVSAGVLVRPSGSRNLTCSGMTFTEIWRQARDNKIFGGSLVPYVLKKTGNPNPVPVSVFSSNTCFIVPCINNGIGKPAGPTWSDIKQHMSFTKKDGVDRNINGL